MSAVRAILRRELIATFATPVAYVTVGLISTLLGAIFVLTTLRTGEPATLRAVLLAAGWALLAAAPAIAMRSFSEEFRQGTWETLLSAPIRPWQAVLGKFIAGVLLLIALIALPAVACGLVLELNANPDWGEIACGIGGLVLAGAAFLAVGLLASTLTANQLVAFLVPVFALFAIALGGRALAAIVPARWAPLAFGLDPLRRVEDFVLGLVDTANIVYFVAVTVAALAVASAALSSVRDGGFGGRARSALGRFVARSDMGLFTLGAFLAALAVAAFFARPAVRLQFDATKTRAYTLSPSTESLLSTLDGTWRIAVLVSEERADPASLRRVDEVLSRMEEAAGSLDAQRIDPDAIESADAYERLLLELTASHQSIIDQWQPALQKASASFESLKAFARSELPLLRAVMRELPEGDAALEPLARIAGGIAQLTELDGVAGESFLDAIKALLTPSSERPLPDWDGARSALVANDRLWADQFSTAAALAGQWARNPSLHPALRAYAAKAESRFEQQATSARAEQYELEELPPLELGEIGRVIGQGEAAIVMGPRGAIAIPSWQIVPAQAARSGRATLGFDFASRAETVLAGAIRSLTVERMPMVVFVHAEDRSVLSASADRNDVSAMADALRTARYAVREWSVVSGAKPAPAKGQRTAWVIVPPLKREGLQVSEREKKLLDATKQLIIANDPVLVTFARNLLPIFGQKDPWDAIAAQLGLSVATGKVVLELVPLSADRVEVQPWQSIEEANREHPVGRALDGQAAVFNHPTPITVNDGTIGATTIASVAPTANRWLEDDWRESARPTKYVPDTKVITSTQPIVVAIENTDPLTNQPRRAIAVGSGGWLLSSVADVTQSLGGNRFALANPGNRELLLTAVAWLSGEGALIERGASGREVARVGAVSEAARGGWLALLSLGVPSAIALVGIGVWVRRRRDA